MNPEEGGDAPPRARPPWASAEKFVWRASVIGLALHAASLMAGAAPGAAPDPARVLLFLGPAWAAAAVWGRARPFVPPAAGRWNRACLEAAAIGPPAAVFAALLGWAAGQPH